MKHIALDVSPEGVYDVVPEGGEMQTKQRRTGRLVLERLLTIAFVCMDGVALVMIAPNNLLWGVTVLALAVALTCVIFLDLIRPD